MLAERLFRERSGIGLSRRRANPRHNILFHPFVDWLGANVLGVSWLPVALPLYLARGAVKSAGACFALHPRVTLPRLKEAVNKATPLQFIPPMLLRLVGNLPEGLGWCYELKFDGYRMQALKDGTTVRLLSRNGAEYTSRFSEVSVDRVSHFHKNSAW